MRRKTLTAVASLSAFVCLPIMPASGDIFPTSVSRSVSITLNNVPESKALNGSMDPFNQSIQDSYSNDSGRQENSYAQQNSLITTADATALPGFGYHSFDISVAGENSFSITGPGINDEVLTGSVTSVQFTLDSPVRFSLMEHSTLENWLGGSNGEVTFAGAQLDNGQTNLLPPIWAFFNTTTDPQPYTGTLDPGTYTYTVGGAGSDDAASSGDVVWASDFEMNAVAAPEPSSLVPIGLMGIAALRRRRRR